MELITWFVTQGPAILTAVIAVLSALIALCLLIPGEQPEKALKSIVDFLTKFSRK